MFIGLGKLMMVGVWGLMLFNLFAPFPSPANIFINGALIFTCVIHGLQVWLYKATMKPGEKNPKVLWGLFFFGLFESLSWRAQIKNNKP